VRQYAFTKDIIIFLNARHISAIALLAWNSNCLDAGIKDFGRNLNGFLATGSQFKLQTGEQTFGISKNDPRKP
jgi:hypothetical protein